jgi:hypothetical protein
MPTLCVATEAIKNAQIAGRINAAAVSEVTVDADELFGSALPAQRTR